MAVDRDTWPFLVRLALWQIPTRNIAWVFFWLSLAIAAGCVAYGFKLGGLMVLAAVWYYLSILWVDKYSAWT